MAGKNVVSITSRSAGKHYAEIHVDTLGGSVVQLGLTRDNPPTTGQQVKTHGLALTKAGFFTTDDTGANTNISLPFAVNDVVMIAVDFAALKIWFGKNGTWALSGNPVAGSNETFSPITAGTYFLGAYVFVDGNAGVYQFSLRTATAQFAYAPPAGFSSWATA